MSHYLVTGGAGFIGSHLSETLLEHGHQVTVIDNLSTGRLENLVNVVDHERFHVTIETITDEMVLDRLVSECDVVIHLAAAVGVELVIKDPIRAIETNVLGAHTVLKTAGRHRRKVLVASSSEIYGKNSQLPLQEDSDRLLGPTTVARWCYASSKALDEFLALAYCRQEALPVVVFRLFNTVGPRQTGRYGMVLPRFVKQALRGEPLTVHEDGSQSRCFLHVQDAVRAIIALAESPRAIGQVYNVGSTEEISILDLARRLLGLVDAAQRGNENLDWTSPASWTGLDARFWTGEAGERIRFVPYEEAYGPGFEDMPRRLPDISRIHRHVGWSPTKPLDEILADVLAHHVAKG
jgi:UDP-glucose 4-epimerase